MAIKKQRTKKPAMKTKCSSEEQNFKNLSKTALLTNFIKKQNGQWSHDEWLGLCDKIRSKGYEPINYDKVGLLLEQKKAAYFS